MEICCRCALQLARTIKDYQTHMVLDRGKSHAFGLSKMGARGHPAATAAASKASRIARALVDSICSFFVAAIRRGSGMAVTGVAPSAGMRRVHVLAKRVPACRLRD